MKSNYKLIILLFMLLKLNGKHTKETLYYLNYFYTLNFYFLMSFHLNFRKKVNLKNQHFQYFINLKIDHYHMLYH
jgi:hypothetical protein